MRLSEIKNNDTKNKVIIFSNDLHCFYPMSPDTGLSFRVG